LSQQHGNLVAGRGEASCAGLVGLSNLERALKRQRQRAAGDESAKVEDEISGGAAAAFASFSPTSSSSVSLLSASSALQATSSQSSPPSTSLAEVLATINLSQFQAHFQSEGYETEADLTELTPVQAEQVCGAIGMKSGHKIRFCRWVREQRLESSSVEAPTAAGTETAEQNQIVQASMRCSITHEPMADPVICEDGQTYERSAIKKWFRTGATTSPATGEVLTSQNLVPNIALRSAIHEVYPEACERYKAEVERRREEQLLPALNAPVDSYGRTQLFMAAASNQVGRVLRLLAAGAAVNQATTTDGATPVFIAAYCGHAEVVSLLLGAGANVNHAKTDDGATPLYVAAEKGHTELVSLLLGGGADVNQARTNDGATPLSLIADNENEEVVNLLLAAGGKV